MTTLRVEKKEVHVTHGDLTDSNRHFMQNYVPERVSMKWNAFFNEFGTHYVSKLELGGRLTTTFTMKQSDVTKIEESGISAAAAVSASVQGKYSSPMGSAS